MSDIKSTGNCLHKWKRGYRKFEKTREEQIADLLVYQTEK